MLDALLAESLYAAGDACYGGHDAFWHFTLYSWLLLRGLKGKLLRVHTPHVVRFLSDPAAQASTTRALSLAGVAMTD